MSYIYSDEQEELLGAIAPTEYEMIDTYVTNYSYGCDLEKRADAKYILRSWADKKQDLFKMFGKNLILKKEISYQKDIEELRQDMYDLIDVPFYYGDVNTLAPHLQFVVACSEQTRKNWKDYRSFGPSDLLRTDTLATNKFPGSGFSVTLPNGEVLKVQHGSKVSRLLGKMANAYGLPHYEEFRIKHSQYLNQRKLEGTLCLSIHPLDYMTMSDNDNCWSSCMSWENGGEYRRGTVEMMNSAFVVVAYLDSKDPMETRLGNTDLTYYWNNKKWRELFIVSEDFIAGIKGYPYQNVYLEQLVMDWLNELSGDKYPKHLYHMNNTYIIHNDEGKTANIHFETNDMYNDFLTRGDKGHPLYIMDYMFSDNDVPHYFNYSGVAICMWCGGEHQEFLSESDLICTNCDISRVRCENCGEPYEREDIFDIDGMLLCEWCVNECTISCDCCGETHLADNMYCLNVVNNDGDIISGSVDVYVDEDCFTTMPFFNDDIATKDIKRGHYDNWKIPKRYLRKSYYDLFGIWEEPDPEEQ